jgi:hypothetical protein
MTTDDRAALLAMIERLRSERDHAERDARYWRDAYFAHMRDEHPEIVKRVDERRRAA